MNMFLKDEVGVPSTLGAIYLNVMHVIGVEIINHFFTWIISVLSIIYLVYKIKNERANYVRHKNDRKN
jgi:hypothetical protein